MNGGRLVGWGGGRWRGGLDVDERRKIGGMGRRYRWKGMLYDRNSINI